MVVVGGGGGGGGKGHAFSRGDILCFSDISQRDPFWQFS